MSGTAGGDAGAVDDATSNPMRAPSARTLAELDGLVVGCRACPRLVAWREHVAEVKRAAFRDETYWGRPVPGFGDPRADVLVVGLAPAAHGANRTGRMFTGDRSGDFLFASMHRTGFASQALSVRADDGLTLDGIRVTAPVRCAPPENAPTPQERRTCGPFLARELALVEPRVVVVLGGFGWQAVLATLAEQGWAVPRPRPAFAHGAEVRLRRVDGDGELALVGCFHVSQQNTFTGRLTPAMLDAVLVRARALASGAG
ncbi:uracil-DNA glycosylase [Cellulomonas fimi]|uniref:Type-5 uracil-DNA glycosylase n=1 Tax=Cellulomonas fimi (strain ATCC 484 / DSM 20113 / JCM 1341 / CCUG 24087 / LMG 16345 / NBRC 15513 / NCIMB 8980 / NCTC 7547 / NRS-133) TaxID=590998 RepID=F4H4K6_CELFA|nr:Uracil-DNA glycosylase superfamily [Cellulomonas fimi ATCC 484]VEH37030.1 uracil-DNA glycosylase, family 4 [Cellulomonas fimi]